MHILMVVHWAAFPHFSKGKRFNFNSHGDDSNGGGIQELSGTPNPSGIFSKVLPVQWEAYCGTNGRRTAVKIGGVLRRFPFSKA